MSFCSTKQRNPFEANEIIVLEFLTSLYESGLGYSAINTARSMLSSLLTIQSGIPIGKWPLVKRFCKGIFNLRPSLPRYSKTWDVDIVLRFLKTLTPVHLISFRFLSYKLVMLMLLLTGQRIKTMSSLTLEDLDITDSNIHINVQSLLKTSRPGVHLKPIDIPAFHEDKNLCVVTVLQEYIQRSATMRKSSHLFINCVKPYQKVSKATLSRWVKLVLKLAGIDVSIFKSHSVRSASTSAALCNSASIETIMKTAGWSKESTFRKFYDKPVSIQEYDDNFSIKVLRSRSQENLD